MDNGNGYKGNPRRHGVSLGVVATAGGWMALHLPAEHAGTVGTGLLVGGPLLVAGSAWSWYQARGGTSAAVGRMSRRQRQHDGVASTWDHMRVSSAWAMRRQATVLRPSMRQLSRWQRLRTPVTAFATPLARVGRHTVWSPCEDVTLRVGGPRVGKTGELAGRIVDAPGGVVATSTRTDLVLLTAPSRARVGQVHLYNLAGLGGWGSNVKWSPLVGCQWPSVAQRRAADMIPTTASVEAERWDTQARRVLGVLMHAAALESLPMRAVLAWVSSPDARAAGEVESILTRRSPDTPETRALRTSATQFFGLNDRTQTSITATIMPALQWLTDARAAALGDVELTDSNLLDVPSLIQQRGTLYLLGAENGLTAPLIAALTAEIAWQGRTLAAQMPYDRLDPPLTIALDEAALVCPVPLDRWTADMGGKGITLHISIQSRAQLRQRWGDAGAATILNNTASILVYGGTRDPDDLAMWAALSGERQEVVNHEDAHGKLTGRTTRPVPVLSQSQVANLSAGQVMIIRRGMPVSIGRTVMAWKRRDIRRDQKKAPFAPIQETTYSPYGESNL